jgi:hypothetical protein
VDIPQPQSQIPPTLTEAELNQQQIMDPTSGYSESPYGLPGPDYSRPPRLPLPIEEELYTPGSPIITPQDLNEGLVHGDATGHILVSRGSVLSSNADEDEDGDNDTFVAETSQSLQPRIPTRLEWNAPGEKIYVTGTFCAWDKKIKLHPNSNGRGYSAILPLPPGTHHIKFLVDGEMVTNPDMPTTVDWSNSLVNYYEVAAPEVPDIAPAKPAPAEPIPIRGANAKQAESTVPGLIVPGSVPKRPPPTTETSLSARAAQQQQQEAQQKQQSTTQPQPIPQQSSSPQPSQQPPRKSSPEPQKLKTIILPRHSYTTSIPSYLIDLDRYNTPHDDRFLRSSRVLTTLPPPPTLPMFLGKSILNAGTPQKDDASVLVIPNHTVINHLATSSIKGGVLAISATTRYKRKVRWIFASSQLQGEDMIALRCGNKLLTLLLL